MIDSMHPNAAKTFRERKKKEIKSFLPVVPLLLVLLTTHPSVNAERGHKQHSIREGRTRRHQRGDFTSVEDSLRRRLFRFGQYRDCTSGCGGWVSDTLGVNDASGVEPSLPNSNSFKRRGTPDPPLSTQSGNIIAARKRREKNPTDIDIKQMLSSSSSSNDDDDESNGPQKRRPSPPVSGEHETIPNDESNGPRKRRPSPPVPGEYETNPNESCLLSAAGFYGTSTGAVYGVQYLYQVQFKAGTTLEAVRTQVLPLLDRAMAQGVVHALFDCHDGRRRGLGYKRQPRQLQPPPQGVFRGVSSAPTDEIMLNQPCVGVSADDCHVFQGDMILIAENFSSPEAVDASFQTVISAVIQSISDLDVSDSIEGVQYLTADARLVEVAITSVPSLVSSRGPHATTSVAPSAPPSVASSTAPQTPPWVVPSGFPSNVPVSVNSASPSLAPSASPLLTTGRPVSVPSQSPSANPEVTPLPAPPLEASPSPNPVVMPLSPSPFEVSSAAPIPSLATSQTPSFSPMATAAPRDPFLPPQQPSPTPDPPSARTSAPSVGSPLGQIANPIPRAFSTTHPTAISDIMAGTRSINTGEPLVSRIHWWGWLLVALGAVTIIMSIVLFMVYLFRRRSNCNTE